MKVKDLILIALVCANVTLASVAVAVYADKAESSAVAASTSRAGDYVIATGPITASKEAVMVIDVVSRRANVYVARAVAGAPVGGAWDLTSTRNLAADFR